MARGVDDASNDVYRFAFVSEDSSISRDLRLPVSPIWKKTIGNCAKEEPRGPRTRRVRALDQHSRPAPAYDHSVLRNSRRGQFLKSIPVRRNVGVGDARCGLPRDARRRRRRTRAAPAGRDAPAEGRRGQRCAFCSSDPVLFCTHGRRAQLTCVRAAPDVECPSCQATPTMSKKRA